MVAQDLATHLFSQTLVGRRGGQAPLIFTGTAHPRLAGEVAGQLGLVIGDLSCRSYPDDEIGITINQPVAGAEVVVVQATNSPKAILELFLLLDALRRAAAGRVTVVISYYGYARQDRRTGLEPNSAALIARQLELAGADAVILLDIHNPAMEGCFRIPVIPLQPVEPFVAAWRQAGLDLARLTLVAPDAGGTKRAEAFCQAIGCKEMIFLHKKRLGAGDCEIYGISGEVAGREVMIVDDILSSGKTLLRAAQTLVDQGAAAVYASVTHLATNQILTELDSSPISRLFVTDSLPTSQASQEKLRVVSIAPLLAAGVAGLLPGFSIGPEK